MKLLALLTIIALCSLRQTPDAWKVTEVHSHLSRYHNSITVQKGDSVLFIQFDFPPTDSIFPAKGNKLIFTSSRKGFIYGKHSYDVINIFKKTL